MDTKLHDLRYIPCGQNSNVFARMPTGSKVSGNHRDYDFCLYSSSSTMKTDRRCMSSYSLCAEQPVLQHISVPLLPCGSRHLQPAGTTTVWEMGVAKNNSCRWPPDPETHRIPYYQNGTSLLVPWIIHTSGTMGCCRKIASEPWGLGALGVQGLGFLPSRTSAITRIM